MESTQVLKCLIEKLHLYDSGKITKFKIVKNDVWFTIKLTDIKGCTIGLVELDIKRILNYLVNKGVLLRYSLTFSPVKLYRLNIPNDMNIRQLTDTILVVNGKEIDLEVPESMEVLTRQEFEDLQPILKEFNAM